MDAIESCRALIVSDDHFVMIATKRSGDGDETENWVSFLQRRICGEWRFV